MNPIWTGTISFGLIHIPIKLYTATPERALGFKFLRKQDNCPIKYEKVCKINNQEVPKEDIVKGYEIEKGKFVILEKEDFEKADAKKKQTIEIQGFVDADQVDKILFKKSYYLEPDEEAQKAYALLRDALKETGKAGIATFVLHEREHLALLDQKEKLLILYVLRFQNEIRNPKTLTNIPEKQTYIKKELDIAKQLINQLEEKFEPQKFKDTYLDKIKKIIEQKAKGQIYEPKFETAPAPDVTDIMAKLKKSLEQAKRHK